MITFLTLASLFRTAASNAARRPSVARHLLERAGAEAGHDRHAAQELRTAALAALRVVR